MHTWPAIDVQRLSEPDLLQAALSDFDVVAIDERTDESWRIFFSSIEARDRAVAQLQPAFPALAFAAVDVADEDWAARSQANLRAIRVGNLIVAPPWDVPSREHVAAASRGRNGSQVIVIQPSMGFGTGH